MVATTFISLSQGLKSCTRAHKPLKTWTGFVSISLSQGEEAYALEDREPTGACVMAHREIPIQRLRVDRLGGERQVDGAGRGHTLASAQLNSMDLWTGFISLNAPGDARS